MALGWLIRLLRRVAPREGWPLFLATLATVIMLAFAVSAHQWVRDLAWPLAGALFLGFLSSFALTRPAWADQESGPAGRAGRWAGLLLFLLGLLAVSLLAGWGQAPAPPQGLRWYLRPAARAGLALLEVWQRLGAWLAGALGPGRGGQEDLAFIWLAAMAGWLAAAWAVWWVFRRRQALAGLLPLGFLLATQIFFAWQGRAWLPVFLGSVAVVMALTRSYSLERRWERLAMDYSREIRIDAYFATLAVGVAVTVMAATMPSLVFRPTARWFAGLMAEPIGRIEEAGKQLFPALQRSPRSLLASGGGPGGLPRAFLLGSGPNLSEELVLRVWTDDLAGLDPGQPQPEPHYWRALTYDSYDGRGWRNGPTETAGFQAGEPWSQVTPALRRPLKQRIEVLRGGDRALFAAGQPLAPNRPYQAQLRAGPDAPADDLVAMLADGRSYDVLSWVPAAAEADLRAAGREYPPGVEARYLALPDGTPQRVLDLAQDVAGQAAMLYDQALALEQFLRGFPYDLDVEAPPPGRDVADYFLFDLRAGYCDYYATAMVVMARSLGIPARLAIGYASGDLDVEAGVYLVAEDSAHSWPELYFLGIGWIPFEPTAARSVFPRHGLASGPAGDRPEQVAADLQTFAEDEIIRRRLRWIVGVPLALLLAGIGYLLWRRRPEPTLAGMYERLGKWGRRLGRSPGQGETAREFGWGLRQRISSAEGDRGKLAATGLGDFIQHFEDARYGRDQAAAEQAARQTWGWLEPLLRRIWITVWPWRRK